MLATLAADVPSGKDWLYEVKWDGYRAVGRVAGGDATLTSRRGNDLTQRFATVARALGRAVRTPDCVIDGEVCALDEQGRSSFSAMQQGSGPLVYYVFDVLEVDGEPLIDLPLGERRERLARLVDPSGGVVRLSDAFEDGRALYDAALAQGLEGVVAKKRESRYQPGKRTREWLKVKTHREQEFVIAGYTKGKGGARPVLAPSSSPSSRMVGSSTSATSARVSPKRRSSGCSASCDRSSGTSRRSWRCRRCRR